MRSTRMRADVRVPSRRLRTTADQANPFSAPLSLRATFRCLFEPSAVRPPPAMTREADLGLALQSAPPFALSPLRAAQSVRPTDRRTSKCMATLFRSAPLLFESTRTPYRMGTAPRAWVHIPGGGGWRGYGATVADRVSNLRPGVRFPVASSFVNRRLRISV